MKKTALLLMMFLLVSCSGKGGGGTTAQIPSLMSPSDMSNEAASKNNEGVDHLGMGHYDVSKPLFEAALAAKPNFAEAHFNLAVTLDGLGKHTEATESFKKALEFGKDNPKISGDALLKKHLGM